MAMIIFITEVDLSGRSGQNIATKELAAALIRCPSVELTLVCPEPMFTFPSELTGAASVKYLPQKNQSSYLWHIRIQWSIFNILQKAIHERRPDALITRMGSSTIIPPMIAKFYKIPYILLIRGMGRPVQKGITGLLIKWFRKSILERVNVQAAIRVYVAFEEIKRELISKNRTPDKEIRILPNGVDPSRFSQISVAYARRDLNFDLKDTDFVIGFAGSLKERHGITALIDAFYIFREREKNARLLIIGVGELQENLVEKVKELGLQKDVVFTGYVLHNDVPRYLSACDVLYGIVHPELPSNPIKCYEYMASGRPIITTRTDELDFVQKIGAGLVLDYFSVESIEGAIKYFKDLSRDERLRMGQIGRDYVLKHHTWDQLAEEIIREIES